MKKIIILLALSLTASAQVLNTSIVSKNKSFSISTFGDFGSNIFYSCDTVEYAVKNLMEQLGGEKIKVSCSGGINPWGGFSSPAYVRLSLDALQEDEAGSITANYQELDFRSSSSCHLFREIIRNTKGLFEITDLNYSNRCNVRFDNFKLSAKVLL